MRMTRRRWLTATAVVWGVLLVVLASLSAGRDPATVREQSSLEQGRLAVDAAVERVRAAAGPGVAVEVRPYQVTTGCRLSLAWDGTELDQVVVLTVPAGQEPALLEKLAQRLPAEWGAFHNRERDRLVADAGDFVSVRGEPADPGAVHVTLRTGCRPGELAQ